MELEGIGQGDGKEDMAGVKSYMRVHTTEQLQDENCESNRLSRIRLRNRCCNGVFALAVARLIIQIRLLTVFNFRCIKFCGELH